MALPRLTRIVHERRSILAHFAARDFAFPALALPGFAFPAVAIAVIALLGGAAPRADAARSAPGKAVDAYKGAIVMDAATGAVVFEDHADLVSPPASMTKLMTYAVLVDLMKSGRLALDTPVTVTAADAKVGMMRDSTAVWLRKGEVFPVEELIYAMMIQSANDAAYALAAQAGGTVDAFVELMNAKARALGMTRSTFRTPNGFPPPSRRLAEGDLTTPRDFAVLCRYLVLHTPILKYTSVRSRSFGAGRRLQPVQMLNHNHLLGSVPGVDGLKTGFTNGAGFCLATTAIRNGRRIIVVMMDSPDSRTRDLHVRELINRGFTALPLGGPAFAAATDSAAAATGPVPVRAAGATAGAAPGATPGTAVGTAGVNAGMTARVASTADPAVVPSASANATSSVRPAAVPTAGSTAGSAAAAAAAPVIRYPGPGGY
jgi:D-alanyl-D-alanine carboxypeptidase (penicillin-binding protein 5/6)